MPVSEYAPEVFGAWAALIEAIEAAVTPDRLDLARATARAALDPGRPAGPRSSAVAFAEQMVVDVAAAQVESGVEYYEIDGVSGELRYGMAPATLPI